MFWMSVSGQQGKHKKASSNWQKKATSNWQHTSRKQLAARKQ